MYLELQPSRTLQQCVLLAHVISLGVVWLLPLHWGAKLLVSGLLLWHVRYARQQWLQAPQWLRWQDEQVELDGTPGQGQILPGGVVTPLLVLLCVQFDRQRVWLPIFYDALPRRAFRELRVQLRMHAAS